MDPHGNHHLHQCPSDVSRADCLYVVERLIQLDEYSEYLWEHLLLCICPLKRWLHSSISFWPSLNDLQAVSCFLKPWDLNDFPQWGHEIRTLSTFLRLFRSVRVGPTIDGMVERSESEERKACWWCVTSHSLQNSYHAFRIISIAWRPLLLSICHPHIITRYIQPITTPLQHSS